MKTGRKSKYPTHVYPKLAIIKAWRRRGVTEEKIAANLAVSVDSLNEYKRAFPELSEVLRSGLDEGVAEVENAHYKAALGYEYEEKKLVYDVDEEGKPKKKPTRIEVTKKFVQPNVTAQIHILKNRASHDWHDRHDIALTGENGGDLVIKVKYVEQDDNG